jgi:exosortase
MSHARLPGLALALLVLWAPTLGQMIHAWRADSYAGHGPFVPLFSALVAWIERDRLRAAAASGHPAGLVLVAAGVAALGLGHLAGSLLLQGFSLVAAVAGVVAWRFGWACLRAAAFPVVFLVLMVPLPRAVVEVVTLELQLFAAGFAAGALRLLGIPVYQTGIVIELPALTLKVAEVCNGLRFLLALLVLTVAFAQVTQRTLGRKIVLTAAAIPIAILANATRVAVIGLAVQLVGPQAASGAIHHAIGKVVWVLTLVPLVVFGILLARGEARTGVESRAPAPLPAASKAGVA